MLRRLSSVRLRCSTWRGLSDSPTSEVRPGHGLDKNSLAAYLRSLGLADGPDSIDLRQFTHGQSNPTYIVSTPLKRLVLRKQPPGKLLKGAHAVDREYRVMHALRNTAVPVPRTLCFCEDPSVLGTPFFCYEYVEGIFLRDPALPEIASSAERRRIYTAMIERLACLHAIDVDQTGLGDFAPRRDNDPSVPPYVLRQVKTWTKQYR